MKLFAQFFFPFSICLIVLLIGLQLLWSKTNIKPAKATLTFGVILLLIFSNNNVAFYLINTLESRYPALVVDKKFLNNNPSLRYIVVLGGYQNPRRDLPITSQMNAAMLTRTIEGIRIYNLIPHSKLILSGGGPLPISDAEVMKRLALSLKVPESDLILEDKSPDTNTEAINLKMMLNDEEFILVTSAAHMPRSMALFTKQGLKPIAAPTAFLARNNSEQFTLADFIPQSKALDLTSDAFYEFLGNTKEKILGHL